jgi:hypothetical protein
MKVEAIKKGFYGKLRRVGDEFEISKKEDLGSWMEEIKQVKAKQVKQEK